MTSPTSSIPRFDEDAVCSKCAHDDIHTLWYENCRTWPCRLHLTRVGHIEHLHRRCERCFYLWVERPLTEDEIQEVVEERARGAAERETANDDDGLTPDLAPDSLEDGV